MLLIIVVGLIANLVLVCDGCDVGTPPMNNFDFNNIADSQPWYALLHSTHGFDDLLDCVVLKFASPVLNESTITFYEFLISPPTETITYGIAHNWNSSGYFEVHLDPMWTGQYYIIAIDYDHYAVVKICPIGSKTTEVYVVYRSNEPDAATLTAAQNAMEQNNIDVSKMSAWNCPYVQ